MNRLGRDTLAAPLGRPRAGGELIGRPIRQSGLNMNLDFVGGPFRASGRIFFDANSYALNAVPSFIVAGQTIEFGSVH